MRRMVLMLLGIATLTLSVQSYAGNGKMWCWLGFNYDDNASGTVTNVAFTPTVTNQGGQGWDFDFPSGVNTMLHVQCGGSYVKSYADWFSDTTRADKNDGNTCLASEPEICYDTWGFQYYYPDCQKDGGLYFGMAFTLSVTVTWKSDYSTATYTIPGFCVGQDNLSKANDEYPDAFLWWIGSAALECQGEAGGPLKYQTDSANRYLQFYFSDINHVHICAQQN